MPAVLSQRVTGFEAKRSYRQLVERWGEPAPGPGGLRLPPLPGRVAELGYYDLHVVGVEKKRADTLKRVCAHAARLEAARELSPLDLRERLEAIPGVGPWTSAEVARVAVGDPDAVSVGDFHLKDVVTFALTGEARGSDSQMLELLEPFAGHRGRVCRLIESAGITTPKLGPRQRIQPLAER
jgi:3-methyladenine DNA glycosylase/8-oxoguanine DNA glycosylase